MSTEALPSPATGRRYAGLTPFAVVLLCAATVVNALQIRTEVLGHAMAYDFGYAYYPSAVRVLHGVSPYAQSPWLLSHHLAFVYPAFAAIVFIPFALLRLVPATHLYMLLCLLLVPLTLWVLRVRDWRVYAAVSLWLPFQVGWQVGNVSVPLAFMFAVFWRERDRPLVAGLVTALAVSIKPFMWPLALFLLVTRRGRAAAWALALGIGLGVLTWSAVGFSQINAYRKTSATDFDALWRHGYSLIAVAHDLGAGRTVGEACLLLVSVALVGWIVSSGRRGRELDVIALTAVLMLVASPIVWIHYFLVLLIPLAAARARFSVRWLLPIAMWVCPRSIDAAGWQLLVAWGAAVAALLPLGYRRHRSRMLDWLMALTRPTRLQIRPLGTVLSKITGEFSPSGR